MGDDSAPEFLIVGFVSKPHGIRGEVYVHPLTDHPEGSFAPGVVLRSAVGEGRRPDSQAPPLRIEAARPFQRGWLVRFEGTSDRNEAERLRARYLFRALDELEPLDADEVFYHQLLGMGVRTIDGAEVGTVQEVYEMRPADLLEVRTPRGTVLIPFQREIVVEVDTAQRRLVVDPPAGLLDL